jgi:hypothetical protein
MTFTRTIIIQAALLFLVLFLMGGSSIAHGFVAPSISRSASSSSSTITQLQIFGWGSGGEEDDKKKTPNKKTAPKKDVKKKEEKKKEPFVFMIGKPQYDWATGEKFYTSSKRQNWLVKPNNNKDKPKK